VSVAPETLTKSQEARRQRVLSAALELGAEGGYDAVQMRDVAQRADVALGTIYRYFSSKDALLSAAMVLWVEDLEARLAQRAPRGDTTAERVYEVLRRAVAGMEREPKLAEAVTTAMKANNNRSAQATSEVSVVLDRIMLRAFPEGVDPETEAAMTKVLGHVWFSCLVSWTTGVGDMAWVADELEIACHLLLDQLD
jgi:AcrR family transcriptional regulator